MPREPAIDREKHDIDMLEHVLKGVHTEAVAHRGADVTDLAVQPWFGGLVVSAVQVQVLPDDESDEGSPL